VSDQNRCIACLGRHTQRGNRDWIYKRFSNHPNHTSVSLPLGLPLGSLGVGSKSMNGLSGATYTTWNRDWIYKCFSNHPTHTLVSLPLGLPLGSLVVVWVGCGRGAQRESVIGHGGCLFKQPNHTTIVRRKFVLFVSCGAFWG